MNTTNFLFNSCRKIFFGGLFLLGTFQNGYAQDLTDDRDFFIKQEILYQKWLNQSGLGQTLRVHSVDVKSDELSLYLEFPFSNTDSVASAWNQLKLEFETQNPVTLEQELFYKMLHIMDVRQTLCKVQLFDTYNLRENPCFFRGIYFDEGTVKVKEEGCKADLQDIEFNAANLSNAQRNTSSQVDWDKTNAAAIAKLKADFSSEKVLNLVYQYAEKKLVQNYSYTECEGRKPTIRQQELSAKTLRFSVEDLCLEVLDDNSWLCPWLQSYFNYDCNWARREKLSFRFTYEETLEGFKISGKVDGYFANGYFDNISRDAYVNMDEEVRFKRDLEEYADLLSNELRQHLKKLVEQ